ncbi:MAG: DUF5677 domain-containing protein [Acidobacteriota bacterium]
MKTMDFGHIQKEFNETLENIENSLKNDVSLSFWKRNTNRVIILNYFQIAKIYFDSLILICELNTKLSISSPAISRSILEMLFSTIYLLSDIDLKVFSLAKTIHRERMREIKELEKLNYDMTYEKEFNNSWSDYLENLYSDLLPANFDWTTNSERFPTLTKITDIFKVISPKTNKFLDFLLVRHYRVLSIDSHIEAWRIAKLTRTLNGEDDGTLLQYKNEQLWFGFVFILAIASEIEANLKYGNREKLTYFWTLFSELCNPAKEIYELRYKELLSY